MTRIALYFLLPLLLSAGQPASASGLQEQLANSRRISAYKTALYAATALSVFDLAVSGIWAGANADLGSEVANVTASQVARAQTIYGVSAASTAVAGLAVLTGGSLVLKAAHDTWFLEMHHDHCRNWVGFREYFLPFVLLAQVGLQTWAGVEITNLKAALSPQTTPTLKGITTSMFWVTTGEMAAATVAAICVPIFGAMLVRHHPLGRGESGLGH